MASALDGLKNNIGNYKGVMLCTRPNESIGQVKERPFISRVDPKDKLGLNPVKRNEGLSIKKPGNPALKRHRQWLEEFKLKMRQKKNEEEAKDREDLEKYERLKEKSLAFRGKAKDNKEEYDQTAAKESPKKSEKYESTKKEDAVNTSQINTTKERKSKKKTEKPRWAYTEDQLNKEEEQDIDELLDFTQGLDYEKYINDLEVRSMIAALKHRINDLKGEETDWKKKIVDAWNNDEEDLRTSLKPHKVDIGDDARSDGGRSAASESKSVASERSVKSIQDLKAKQTEKKDWEKLSSTQTKKQATLEERIAKHVADEILRNNTQIRHVHSNNSIRKLLEREAKKHLESIKGVPEPKIVENNERLLRKNYDDPNTLPYLHRNPAI